MIFHVCCNRLPEGIYLFYIHKTMVLATDLNVLVEPVPIRQVYAAMIQDTGLAEGRDRSHGSREDAAIPVTHGETTWG